MDDAAQPRTRKAVGPDRPRYYGAEDVDTVMAVLLALISDVASIRERLDSHERLGAHGVLPAPAAVEGYVADEAAESEREAWRDGFIRRLFRVIAEDGAPTPPVD